MELTRELLDELETDVRAKLNATAGLAGNVLVSGADVLSLIAAARELEELKSSGKEPICEVKTEDGDDCANAATHFRELKLAPRYACEECVAALIDEDKVDHDFFKEIADMAAKEPTVERRHLEVAVRVMLPGADEQGVRILSDRPTGPIRAVAKGLAAAEQTSAERAWDEGYEAAGKVVHPGVNPYRQPKGPTK